jgi:hypothetical protein
MSQNSDKQKEVLEKQQKNFNQLKRCVEIASSTPEGIIAFRQLLNMCGYNKSVVVVNPQQGGIDTVGSVYNAARENIWKEFRQLIPARTLKKIEFEKTHYLEEEND